VSQLARFKEHGHVFVRREAIDMVKPIRFEEFVIATSKCPSLRTTGPCVYEIWAEDESRYVGCSCDLGARLQSHWRTDNHCLRSDYKEWTVKVHWYETIEDARAEEHIRLVFPTSEMRNSITYTHETVNKYEMVTIQVPADTMEIIRNMLWHYPGLNVEAFLIGGVGHVVREICREDGLNYQSRRSSEYYTGE